MQQLKAYIRVIIRKRITQFGLESHSDGGWSKIVRSEDGRMGKQLCDLGQMNVIYSFCRGSAR